MLSPDCAVLVRARQQLAEYFSGNRHDFCLPLDLSPGSPFQRSVWEAARHIPYGRTSTYGEIAQAVGIPNAARAVGNALANNPVPIIVPCHRVLRADGAWGGYRGGLEIKKVLLSLERETLHPARE